MTSLRRLSRRTRLALVAALSLVLLASLTVAARAASTGDGNYRTAVAALGTVTETVSTSGTIDSSDRRDVASAVAGTTGRVARQEGAKVKAGDVLVVLDRSQLRRSVRKAKAALAQARADLEGAETSQTSAVETNQSPATTPSTAAPRTTSTTKATSTSRPKTSAPATTPSAAPLPKVDLPEATQLRELQDEVKTAQSATSTALADAAGALDAQETACASAYGRGAGGTGESPDQTTRQTTDDATNDDCDQALAAVEAAQQVVSDRQIGLQAALDRLTDALAAALKQTDMGLSTLQQWLDRQGKASNTGGKPGTDGNAGTTAAPSTGSDVPQAAGSASPSGQAAAAPSTASTPVAVASASAMSVAQAQAAVDAAQTSLLEARQQLAAARITAPTAGTVTAINVAEGDPVAAGDTVATVVGDGGATIMLSLTSTSVRKVAAGQAAEVTLPGATDSVDGEVTWVSPVASSSSSSSPFGQDSSYAALVVVPAKALARQVLPQGARADVVITVGTSKDTLTVPSSAVLPRAGGSTVQVIGDDGSEARTVQVGRTGTARTQITDGLEAGDRVVLADLDAEIDAAGEIETGGGNAGPGGRGFPGGGPPTGGMGGRMGAGRGQ